MRERKLLFIRNDDVYNYTENFKNLFLSFKKYSIPVIYGIIPNLIEKKLVHFLNKEKKKNSHLLDITQHGFSHKNYSKNKENKYEFGPTRTYIQQKQDIYKGYLKMQKLFGNNFTPAFIPPYHGYDFKTLKIINELKIPIFSAGYKTMFKDKSFLDLPAQVSTNKYNHKGKPLFSSLDEIIRNFVIAKNRYLITGILIHPNTLNYKSFKILKDFFKILNKLRNRNTIEIVTFSQILKYKRL